MNVMTLYVNMLYLCMSKMCSSCSSFTMNMNIAATMLEPKTHTLFRFQKLKRLHIISLITKYSVYLTFIIYISQLHYIKECT